MCGIVSIFAYNDAAGVDHDELSRIRDRMISRGPDGFGEWFARDNRVGLGHRRLAIIDLSEAGTQPMVNDKNDLIITFNGEIYNYQELRAKLRTQGYHFRSNSDTEVLLHLYAEKGEDMVHELRGMYAFAIWDVQKKGLFLARDPFGIKPLYYSDDKKTFRAASQVKALLAGGRIDTTLESAGHVGFFLWGHIPEPFTLYKGIRELPAGSSLWVDNSGQKKINSFCAISAELSKLSTNNHYSDHVEMTTRLREALKESLSYHLIADVPVGIFLSSGLDSTSLTALTSEIISSPLHSVTLGFGEYQGTANDEVPLAEMVAKKYGTIHETIWVTKTDFQSELHRLFDAMDQPSVDGVNSYFISQAAVEAGLKVAISGLGGDELFGSYPSFRQIPQMVYLLSGMASIGKAFRFISAPLLTHFTSPKYAGLFEYGGSYSGAYLLRRGMFMPWELPELLDREVVKEGWAKLQTLPQLELTIKGIDNGYRKVSSLEMCWYMRNQLLRDADWASMAHSLETRVPLVDIELLRSVAPMLGTENALNKYDMATSPAKALPEAVLKRGKTGFSIPVREWLMSDQDSAEERSLRGWSKQVYQEFCGK